MFSILTIESHYDLNLQTWHSLNIEVVPIEFWGFEKRISDDQRNRSWQDSFTNKEYGH